MLSATLPKALEILANIWSESETATAAARSLNFSELDPLARVLDLAGRPDAARTIMRAWRDSDEDSAELADTLREAWGILPAEDECRECESPTDDGEGADGLCGNCADRVSCSECYESFEGQLGAGHGMCASCLHDARRSGWEPGE